MKRGTRTDGHRVIVSKFWHVWASKVIVTFDLFKLVTLIHMSISCMGSTGSSRPGSAVVGPVAQEQGMLETVQNLDMGSG